MDRDAKLREIGELRSRIRALEAELERDAVEPSYAEASYVAYDVVNGCILGVFGAAMSLLFNVVGSWLVDQHPLQLIRVFLTFPMGADALAVKNVETLALGCCLYLATGMLLGIPFQLLLSQWCRGSSFLKKFLITSLLALMLWLINFYGILAWLQPLLFGGNWIVKEIPWWVGALTHLIFGWTILLASPLGQFTRYRRLSEAA